MWRWLVVVGAFAQIAAASSHLWLPSLGLVEEAASVGRQSAEVSTALTPAGYAFSIWGPIFLGSLLYAAWQFRSDAPQAAGAAPWAAAAFWGCAVWQTLVPATGFGWVAQGVLGAIALSATCATRVLMSAHRSEAWQRWLVALPLATLAGWTIAAFCVGLTATLVDNGLVSRQRLSGGWPVFALLALLTALGAAGLLAVGGHLMTLGALVWALVAVGVANQGNPDWGGSERLVLWAAAGTLCVVALFALRRRRW